MDKDISRKNLRRHGIYYEPNVYQGNHENTGSTAHSLPDHVDAVRDGLLFMEKILPEDCNATLLEDFDKFGSTDIGPDWCLRPPSAALVRGTHYERMRQESAYHDNLRSCEKIVERAKIIMTDPEAEWSHFWRREMFKLFSDDTPEHSNLSPTFDRWSVYENVRWNEYGNVVKPHLLAPNRTLPQPDLTYAFPIQTSMPDNLKGFARDELTQSFSLESLRKLVTQGVACAPTTALRHSICHPTREEWSSPDASCFPWAIVEMKKTVSDPNGDAIERCYSQAANAATAALDIQGQLFDKLTKSCPFQRPPVVVFTCVGPVVKVWLAYQDKSNLFSIPIQRMVCIWSTSVNLIWGVASLRAIIRNMHTWSSRLLKPKLQAAISQASVNLSILGQIDSQHPSSQRRSVLTTNHLVAGAEGSSPSPSRHLSPATSIISQAEPTTPKAHQIPVLCPQITTATRSRCPEDTSPRRNRQAKEPSSSCKDAGLVSRLGALGATSTTRTPGLFGRGTGSRTSLFYETSSKGYISTATGIRFWSPPEPACVSSPKPAFSDSGNSSKSDAGTVEFSTSSNNISLSSPGKIASLSAARDTDVCDLTTAFKSASLESVFDHGPAFGTAGTPFSAHTEWDDQLSKFQQYQTITFQSPYQDYSLEELRMADYDRGRRYRSPSNELAQSTDTPSTERNHNDNPNDGPFGTQRPRTSGRAREFGKDASHRIDNNARCTCGLPC